MTTRQIIVKVHLWVGMATGLVLSVVGITGAVYLFQPEVDAWLYEDLYRPSRQGEAMSAQALTRRVEGHFDGAQVQSVQWPNRERRTYMFKLFGDPGWHHFDQYTGEYLGTRPPSTFFTVVRDIHTSLTMGTVGRYITGVSSLLLALALVSSGLFLWLPRRLAHLGKRLTVKWGGKAKRVNYDLHNALGFYFAIPLVLLSLTGAYFVFPNAVQSGFNAVTFSEAAKPQPTLTSTPTPSQDPLTVHEALERMDDLYPSMYKRNMWMPSDSTGTISMAFMNINRIQPGPLVRAFVKVDQYSGEVLDMDRPSERPRGTRWLRNYLFPIHFGEVGGLATRILAFFVALTPAVLFVTGVYIWYSPGRRRKSIEKKSQAGSGGASGSPTAAPTEENQEVPVRSVTADLPRPESD